MITENLSTLKIHKLSQAQYNRELEAGRIDENALYLTPDEDGDVVGQATEQGGEIFNDYNNNQATAPYSHAQGQSTKATGVASSTSGFNTEAAHTHQFVVGRYNDNKNITLFEVGNGKTNNSRSNAFEAYADGHAEVQTMGTTNKSVATKEYVDNANIDVLLKKIDASYDIAGKGANVPDTGVFIRTLVSISIDGNICIFGENVEDQIAFSFSPERPVNEIPGLIEGKLYRITIIDENSNILELCNIEGVEQSYNPESVLPLSGKAVAEAMVNYVDSRLYISSEPPANPVEGMIWITPLG